MTDHDSIRQAELRRRWRTRAAIGVYAVALLLLYRFVAAAPPSAPPLADPPSSRAAPAALCADKPVLETERAVRGAQRPWSSPAGHSCHDYRALQLCTEAGAPGVGWNENFGAFSDWSYGMGATEACCACGGGVHRKRHEDGSSWPKSS